MQLLHHIKHGLSLQDLHSPKTFNFLKLIFDFVMFTVVMLDSVCCFVWKRHYILSFGNKFIDSNCPG